MYCVPPTRILNYSENARFDILTVVLLKFKSSGTQHCAIQHAVPDVLKDNSACIIRHKQSCQTSWPWRWRHHNPSKCQ